MIAYSKFKQFLSTSGYQFGFKPGLSMLSCIFSLKEAVNYYHCLNSTAYTCSTDIKSASLRVTFIKLSGKLRNKGASLYMVLLLLDWYTGQRLYVKWGCTRLQSFGVLNRLKQGSVISPYLFKVYLDE